jgi:hypothetical protein
MALFLVAKRRAMTGGGVKWSIEGKDFSHWQDGAD